MNEKNPRGKTRADTMLGLAKNLKAMADVFADDAAAAQLDDRYQDADWLWECAHTARRAALVMEHAVKRLSVKEGAANGIPSPTADRQTTTTRM